MSDTNLPGIEPGCIAIVGMAGRFPASRTPGDLWKLLAAGREATQWLTDDELRAAGVPEADLADPNYVRAGLVLPDMESFDAEFFGFSRRDAAILDPQHRHFLECAWEALEDAGHPPEKFAGAIGVFGGCGMQAYLPYNLLTNPELRKSVGLFLLRHTGNDKDFLTTRVSYLLDLKGPSVGIQTACSTSLVAVHVAAQSLLSGECDMALAGAASIELPHRQGYRYAEGEILSPDGHCRAFDESASGTLFGSGAAMVVLRRLEDAVRDRDNIYAVIRGSAVNNDGSQKAGYLAPSVDGQARAAVEALGIANVDPASVNYIEAHGTGTPVGDPIEVAALTQAYGEGGTGFCGIGSIKTNIGHLDTAAGVASLIKVSLALRHELIPPSLNFSRPNSRFDLDKTPFRVVQDAQPWKRAAAPRRAAVNSLGVGGTNAHVIVEEPPLLPVQAPAQPWQVLALSARTPASLERLKAKWSDFLAQPPAGFTLPDAAFTTQEGRRGFPHRCAIVARDLAGLQASLEARQPLRSAAAKAGSQAPQVVMMFPGGGASYPGAGRDLLEQPAFSAAVDECFRLMPGTAPADLRSVMFEREPGDAQAAKVLEQPRYNIPALFVLEYALARLWESWGVKPAAVIGHSAGEYAAAAISGVMGLADALSVVVLRGNLFEEVPAGGMLAVDLPEDGLRAVAEGLDLDVAVINAPDLTIASGTVAAIGALEQRLKAEGREGRRLHINVAAHSRLLDGILERFRQGVARLRLAAPGVPFISNLSGDWADAALLGDPGYWVRHLRQPVRFADGLARLLEMGADTVLLEVGPGQGLGALARQNLQGQSRTVLASTCKPQEATGDLPLMLTSLGALWARGAAPAWDAVRGSGQPRRISLPTYAFDHQRHWIEPGKVTHEQAPQQEAMPAQALRRLPRLDDWFGVPQWSPSPLPQGDPVAAGEQWLVFGGDRPLAAAVLRRIADEGGKATLVRHGAAFAPGADGGFTIDAADESQYERLFSALEQAGRLPDRIVHLWSLETPATGQGGGVLHGQALAFDSLVHVAKALQVMDVRQPVRLAVVSAGGQPVNGARVQHPVRSLALGPVRVIPREVPNVSTVLVDLDPAEAAGTAPARAIVAECRTPTPSDLVGWRDGARWIAQLVKPSATAAAAKPLVREGGVYLVTGGLGGIALELAGFLAQRYRARLALVSRRTLPARSQWDTLAGGTGEQAALLRRLLALEAEGGEVATFAADVADAPAMARVLADVRQRWGAVHGVFHAAGTLQDGPIATKTGEAMRQVLSPKAAGAQVLHELLPPGELDLFALFSSTSVFLGPPGQVDYVAANAFLDAVAAARPDGLAIHWGIWADTGMAARAYGRAAPPAVSPGDHHPLLGTQVDDDTGTAFEATYGANDLWVLREHRVADRSVLPGTAYIEIARAAMAQLHPGAGVEIRSLSFEEAMVFEPGASRQVRIDLRRGGDGYEFLVRSRSDSAEPWQQHARATVARLRGTLAPHAQRPSGSWREGELPQGGVEFGPRWHNIARMQLGGKHGVAEMALAERYATDLQPYALHPAVTDMACTFGLQLLDPAQRKDMLFVPLSIDRIRIVAPLPLRSISRVELRSPPQDRFAAFDVSLHTPEGAPIATFEGFSLRGIDPNAMSRHAHARREPTLAEAMLACGLRAEEAPALFERVLGGGARDVVVSSLSLSAIRRAMSDAAPKPLPVAATRAPAANAASLNPVETVIADVWRELLGVDEVAREDDFFALGGHSLAAVRLFARIRKQWNIDLPLATLFQGSTLAGLATIVAHAGNLDTTMPGQQAPAAAPASNVIQLPRAWSPLVPICKGADDRRPLFCVHGAGGNVLNFKVISDRLGPQQPFYGLQAQGVDGRLPPLSTIEDMAAQYVEAIRAVDPTGPYRLAGYSAGGVIAYEMAQQLRRDGARVETILMIDTLSPTAATAKVPLLEKIWLKRHWTLDFALDWPVRRRRGRQMQHSYQLALEKLARGEPLPPELVDFHLFRNFTDAQAQYRPEPYDGEVVLFKAAQAETLYLYAGPTLGWDQHATGPIRVTRIGGSHFTMMAEPGVSEVIEGIRRELARLDGEGDAGSADGKRPGQRPVVTGSFISPVA
ncbi:MULTISPECIES: type I polyketide synthase [Ramlibacter]|uniref:Phenolphthiocerol/phthiocerol polyketide synthase subunit E n=1 Tax=Ramlibacter pinisoli TaxID=2682844 RepID=A0A6N8IUI2_9BURK|nr:MULTISPECIES: type I polyketide synthase [Ramlibacter]MBA2964701.1 KR domain-containing protein [Ramlibacter sp. CGMCC 1.13660]MVQ29666.1 KR domain-containing protein [Ramlibacter pinisoli]